jgi:inner membrane protein
MTMEILENMVAFWLLLGILLALSELIVPGLVIIFFGIGALITSLATWVFDPTLTVQVAIFLASSVGSLILFRNVIKKRYSGDVDESDESSAKEFIGKKAVVTEVNINAREFSVEFRGTTWMAFSSEELNVGDEVIITDKKSIKLQIKKSETYE